MTARAPRLLALAFAAISFAVSPTLPAGGAHRASHWQPAPPLPVDDDEDREREDAALAEDGDDDGRDVQERMGSVR